MSASDGAASDSSDPESASTLAPASTPGPVSEESSRISCPTCGARQALSPQCRRCRCDLSLLVDWAELVAEQRRAVLYDLRRRAYVDALRLARRVFELDNSQAQRRLLAMCALLAGDRDTAIGLAGKE